MRLAGMMVRRAEGKDSRDSHLGLELTGLSERSKGEGGPCDDLGFRVAVAVDDVGHNWGRPWKRGNSQKGVLKRVVF